MPNVMLLCMKCNYKFSATVKSIDNILMRIPGTCPSCPRCRRKRWLRLMEAEG